MKKLLYILLPLVAIVVAIFAIVFTPFGSNKILKPIVNSIIDKKLKEPKVTITKLDSKYGYIDLEGNASNGIKFRAKGDVDYFKKSFDLNYNLNAKSVKVENKDIFVKMDIGGQAVGTIKNFGVNGEGRAFDSPLDYKFIIKDNKPQEINANVNGAKLYKVFALANIPPYADGYAFVNVNMPSLDIKNPSGKGHLEIREGRFNRALIKKKFNIALKKDERFSANIDSIVAKKFIISKGTIDTTTAKLNIKKVTSTLDFLVSKGYFDLNINKLSRLNSIVKQNLKGKLKLDGAFYVNAKKGIKQANIKTKSFGGLTKVFYSNNSIKATLKSVSIPKVLYTISQPRYVKSGLLNANIAVPNLQKLNGSFKIKSSGVLNPKMLKIKLPSYKYSISSKGSLKNGTIYAKQSSLITNFAKVYLSNTKYSLLTKALSSNYSANIKELAALNKITGAKLRGALKATGKIKQQGANVDLSAFSKSLGGSVKLHYQNGRLNVKLNKVLAPKLLYMAYQPHLLNSGIVNGVVKLSSTKPLNGLFSIASKGSLDTKTLQKLYKINLGKKFAYALNVKDGVIKKGVVIAKPTINTTIGSVKFSKLVYNTKNSSLKAKYLVNIDDLAKLEPLVKQKLNGKFDLSGDIKYSPNNLLVTGIANELGGTINFILHNNKLLLDGAGLSVIKVTNMLNYPKFLDAVAKVHFDYNTKSKKGKFNANLNDARFLNSQLVVLLKQYAHFDLSKELFSNAKIDGVIDNSLIIFNLKTDSQRTKITVKNGKIDTKNQRIDAKVSFVYNGNDYQFRVVGDIKNPKIKPVFGGYLKRKVIEKVEEKVLGKKVDKEKLEQKAKEKIKKVIPKEVKGLLQNLIH